MAILSSLLRQQWCRIPTRLRAFCTVNKKYLEIEQLKDIKSEEFYNRQGQMRRYFYYIDLQGRVFLEDTLPKNIATSLKSAKFLRFFFSQIRPNRTLQCKTKGEEDFLEYPFRSPCGKEMNFIKCADRPFVFEDLHRDDSRGKWMLTFGGGELKMPFLPETLRISVSTGRLYHDVQTKFVAPGTSEGVALIRSQLAVELGKHIDVNSLSEVVGSGQDIKTLEIGGFMWCDQRYAIYAIE